MDIHAEVISKAGSVRAEIELVVSLVEVAEAGNDFGFPITFESGTRKNVEDTLGAVAFGSIVAPALHFEIVHVLRIKLRTNVGSDVRVRNRDTINEPVHLMTAPNVELIVSEIRAGDIVSDYGEAVTVGGTGSARDVGATDQRGGCRRVSGRRFRLSGDRYRFFHCGEFELVVQHGLGARLDDNALRGLHKAWACHRNGVLAERNSAKRELPRSIGVRRSNPIRGF